MRKWGRAGESLAVGNTFAASSGQVCSFKAGNQSRYMADHLTHLHDEVYLGQYPRQWLGLMVSNKEA
jgi:hypothetical protein